MSILGPKLLIVIDLRRCYHVIDLPILYCRPDIVCPGFHYQTYNDFIHFNLCCAGQWYGVVGHIWKFNRVRAPACELSELVVCGQLRARRLMKMPALNFTWEH